LVPQTHWEDLRKRNLQKVCNSSGAKLHPPDRLLVPFLNETICIDVEEKCLYRVVKEHSEKIENPLFELITVVYLLSAADIPLRQEMIGVKELKDAHFFQGPHALNFSPLLMQYGNDLVAFDMAAKQLEGIPMDMADSAYKLNPYPKIPVYYLLWTGDEEFRPNISVLFDRTVEQHFSADAIWGLVHVVNDKLLNAISKP
jgi:hypothetical protein